MKIREVIEKFEFLNKIENVSIIFTERTAFINSKSVNAKTRIDEHCEEAIIYSYGNGRENGEFHFFRNSQDNYFFISRGIIDNFLGNINLKNYRHKNKIIANIFISNKEIYFRAFNKEEIFYENIFPVLSRSVNARIKEESDIKIRFMLLHQILKNGFDCDTIGVQFQNGSSFMLFNRRSKRVFDIKSIVN